MSRRVLFLFTVAALALGGCATIPQPLAGNYAPVTLDAARSGTANAAQVRWGGEIVETQPREQQTCFFVLAEPLDAQARPKPGEDSLRSEERRVGKEWRSRWAPEHEHQQQQTDDN